MLIDQDELNNIIQGDEDLLAELTTMFVQYLPDMQSRLRLAVADRNVSSLQENAHQLKSRLAYFGATTLREIASELESSDANIPMQDIGGRIELLLAGCSDLVGELNDLTGLALRVDEDE